MPSLYEIALTFIPGVGDVTARGLLEYFGSAEAVFKASQARLKAVQGIGDKIAANIHSKDILMRAEKELAFVNKYKIRTLFYTSEEYPARLKNCYDAPVLLYYKGNAGLNSSRIISVVGTRKATSYGKELTRQLIEGLKQHNVIVISGLAYGIDGMAHKECVQQNIPTIGVVGHGLDRIYPAQHRPLAEKMIANGGLLTEFPSGTNPDRENFPKRNRIVAGLADATVIVEAAVNGGALITAELANSYDRDVFAFPGRTNDEFSSGCNYLIKTNRAHLITGIRDIEYLMGWEVKEPVSARKQLSLSLDLSEDEKKVTDILVAKGQPVPVDEISLLAGLPQSKLAIILLNLEMQGIIAALPGKTYKLL